jgi:DHA1 family bicyclomycin/chloramphenicol resistance-like MFS transporter
MTGPDSKSGVARAPLLTTLALVTALAPLSMDVYTPSLPRMVRDLGGPDWVIQASITACLLGLGVGQLVFGPLSDRIGRRPVLLLGVVGWALTSVASAAVPTAMVLIVVRLAAGLFGAAGIVVARSVVRDLSVSPREIGGRIALLATVSAAAPIVAPTIGAAIADAWGWRADFVAMAILGALVVVAVTVLVPESLPVEARTADARVGRALASALRNRELRALALSLGLQAFGFYAYIATASFVVETEFGYGPGAFALVFGTNAAAMCAANLTFRRLVRRRPASALMGIGLVAALCAGAVLAVAAAIHGPAFVLWTASTLFAAGIGFVLPGAHSWGQSTATASGAASALTGAAQFFGGVLGSPATGILGPTALNLGVIVASSSVLAIVAWTVAHRARASTLPAHHIESI